MIFFGHSAGGQFGFHFACWKPERTIAFVTAKGGRYNETVICDEAKKIPSLWIIGEKDETWRIETIERILRENKGNWKIEIDSKTGHEIGKSEKKGVLFIQKIPIN